MNCRYEEIEYGDFQNNTIKSLVKKFSRINVSKDKMQETLDKVDQTESRFSRPEIQYDLSLDLNRFYKEALKIAFEYAIYKLEDEYLKDFRTIEIQQYLKSAIHGKIKMNV